MRFRREVIDDLERIGDADLYGALRRRCEKAVVPSATIAKALAAARKGKAGNDPGVDFLRFYDIGIDRLADSHRAAPQILLVQSLQFREFVSIAVPARRDHFDAHVKHVLDEGIDVDFIGRGEVDGERRAEVERIDHQADIASRLELFADGGIRGDLLIRRKLLPPRLHRAPKLGLVAAAIHHCPF